MNWLRQIDFWKNIKELLQAIILALIIVIPFRFFIAEPFLVEGASMEPNFSTADYLIVSKITKIQRGDVVILVPPKERKDDWKNIIPFLDQRDKYLKRIVALPNEEIKLEDGKVFIKKKNEKNFIKLVEPYIKNVNIKTKKIVKLKDNEFFVLGDNRPNSRDSEEFGPIKKTDIIGEPFLQLLPFQEASFFPANYKSI